jgi:hypothetical protein
MHSSVDIIYKDLPTNKDHKQDRSSTSLLATEIRSQSRKWLHGGQRSYPVNGGPVKSWLFEIKDGWKFRG